MLLDLFFEAWEGGIKKDPSTFSYYFVTTGLAFMALLAFSILERYGYLRQLIYFLALNGKNPMVAYTAASLLGRPNHAAPDVLFSQSGDRLTGEKGSITFCAAC
ncbi:hypothetical protein [Chitinophaga defluvii]|uniref:Uncharacterized protein n=1 Tax=Chitinophaga defluvii TaxID=3163343 RepID=A0ABV2TBD5_9BACT